MKKHRRILLPLLAAAAITASTVLPAAAAQETPSATKSHSSRHSQILIQLQDRFGTHSWLWDLICSWDPGCSTPEEKPEVPEEKPDVPAPEIPDVPAPEAPMPEAPDSSVPENRPEPDTPSAVVHAYEKKVVDLVNVQRAKHGLSPLALSEDLCVKARIKSKDMATNNYFSHNSPTYGSPFDMMKALGISYRTAGENIAMGYADPAAVVTAWMNSQGHRENILSSRYTTIGIGYIADGGYWTQWFIG